MAAPEGYDLLARIGFVDKGNYVAGTTYLVGDVVYYNGSTWVALKDNLKGVTPTNGANWKYMARGFAAELLSLVTAKDTSGLKGTAGANVDAQSLMDVIADKVATKLLAKSQIVNNLLATVAGNVLDATQGKALKDAIDQVNRDLTLKTGTVAITSHITDGTVYVERVGNVVHLYCRWELTLTGSPGTGVTLFTVPDGFRPYKTYRTLAQLDYNIGVRQLEIATSGTVSLQGSGAGNATSLLFDAVYFTN